MPTGGYCGLPLAAAACHRVAAPPSPLERVSNMRMRDVQEEEQRRPRELYTRAKQNMSNKDEPRARDEGSRAEQRDARLLGAGCRGARGPAGQDGRGLCWAGRQCRDGPEAWAPSSVGGAAEHLNEDVRDAGRLGLDGRCGEEEDGSTRAGTLRFSLLSSSGQGEEVNDATATCAQGVD